MTAEIAPLDNRVAIVTGAAQGLGFSTAQALRDAGARLALVDTNADGLTTAARELGGGADRVASFVSDLADTTAVTALPNRVLEHFGDIDILVNNAGIRHIDAFLDYPLDKWQQTLDVNLTAPFLLSQAAIPHLITKGKGKIVNIASIAGTLAFHNRAAYNATKAALIMLTKTIALELGDKGIFCNAIGPGIIETPLTHEYFADPELRTNILRNSPMQRWGQPHEIADPVVFLCSDASDFVNGTTLFVDGAWTAGKGY